jgi:hypothetical protein
MIGSSPLPSPGAREGGATPLRDEARQKHQPPRANPVARSPLLRKGGAHGKTTAAKRREHAVELQKLIRREDPDT